MSIREKLNSPEELFKLMPNRIRKILVVSTLYDAFIIEKDGQMVEQIGDKFHDMNLVYVPKITRVSSLQEALAVLENNRFDLVITMMNLLDTDAFQLAREIKSRKSDLPVVLLLSDPSYLNSVVAPNKDSILDGVFFWSGDPSLFFPIIKLIEDKKNVEHDIATGLVKVVLVIDDSVKYYSTFLPVVYKEIMNQTHRLITENLNTVQKLIRMSTRPKILLASNFEDAMDIYNRYKMDIIGIISDVSFPKQGKLCESAGFDFAKYVKQLFFDMPIALMSAEIQNKSIAESLGISYIDKNSRHYQLDLRDFILGYMGFGDFIFRLPEGKEIARAYNIKDFQERLKNIPDDSLLYHSARNHISIWLNARGHYEIARKIRPLQISDFDGKVDALRSHLIEAISSYRADEQTGVVVEYKPGDWDSRFIQIGTGSLGGKARGIAFVNYLLATTEIRKKFPNVRILIPQTFSIAVDEFDQFIETNQLKDIYLLSDDSQIAQKFLDGKLSEPLEKALTDFLSHCNHPLAVRSSSLLEDSQFLPFAGIYSTYMIPNNDASLPVRLAQLVRAIKLVYASVFFKISKSYIESTPYKISEEKMGVVIEEIVGQTHSGYFYPTFAGVAKTYNYYPFSYIKPEEGVAQIGLGLGRLVIDGENCLRICPKYPDVIPQFFSVENTFKSSQKHFYALDLSARAEDMFISDLANICCLDIQNADEHSLRVLASTYDVNENCFRDDPLIKGPKVVMFANILKYNMFPLSEILSELLALLKASVGRDIEIEFAVNMFSESERRPIFYILQIRPLVLNKEEINITDQERLRENALCRCKKTLGNGISQISDIIFVDPDKFDTAKTREMAEEVGKLNNLLKEKNRPYLLIGMGRWGTADPWLGIPVNWEQISNAQAIVETPIQNFFFEPSQGSHFFQNITARSIGYFCIPNDTESFVQWDYLKSLPVKDRLEYVCHLEMPNPLKIKIDGKTGEGVICKAL